MTALHKAAQQALDFCEFLWREVTLNDYAEALRHETEVQLIAALADHSGDATEMDQEIEAAMADQVTHGLGITLGGKRIDPASIYKQAEPATKQESRHAEPVAWLESPHGSIRANPNYKFTFPSQLLHWQIPLYTATPKADPVQEPAAWLRAIDEAMVVHDCGVVDHADDYETAKRKLNTLLNTVQDIGSYFASSQQHAAQVVYQISMKDGAASSAWVDVDEPTYNSAKLYGEYKCRILYTGGNNG